MPSWIINDSLSTVVDGFQLSWLPPQAAPYVTPHVHYRGDAESIALEAGPYVGALPLTTGETLYIAPRIGNQSLSRMLAVTERLDDAIRREFEEFANLGSDGDEALSWAELLSRTFIHQLRLIEKSSLRSDRVMVRERRESVKGRIYVTPTLVSLKRGESVPVHCGYRQKNYQTAENRVLGAAAATLLNIHVMDDEGRAVALRWATRLQEHPLSEVELRTVVKALNAGHYTGPRAYYIRALVMAQLILMQGGLTLNDANPIRTEALLTNVYSMFESYIRITLRRAFSEQGYVVHKLERGAPTLFADGKAELKPDVIISDGSGVRLLVDAKYKLNQAVQASDYYQMAAYLKGYQVQHGVIVRPRAANGSTPLISRRLNYGGFIHELDIGLNDWEAAEATLVKGINQVLVAQ